MSENPYAAPGADLTVASPATETVPDAILKKIRNACIAGLISAAITLAVTLFAIAGNSNFGFDAWNLIDVAIILGLTFGIYKKSRVCAILMLLYFVVSKILIVVETGKVNGLLLALVFAYYYAQGVLGTFAYHKHIKG